MKKHFRTNPFQLDLFKKTIRLGFSHLSRLKSGMKFYAAFARQKVTYRFTRNDQFVFEFMGNLFSVSAREVAMLEIAR